MKIVSLVLAVFAVISVKADDLPDELNYRRYEQIFQESRQVSESQRTEANRLAGIASSRYSEWDGTRGELARIQNRIRSDQNEVSELSSESSSLESENSTLRNQISNSESESNRLRNQLRESQSNYQNAQSILNRLDNERDQAERRLNPLRQRINEAERRVSSAESEVNQAQNALNNAQNSLRTARDSLNRNNQEIQQATQEESQLARRVDDLQRELQGIDQTISNLRSQIASECGREDRDDHNSAAGSSSTPACDELRNRLREAEQRRDQTRNGRQEAESRLSQVRSNLSTLRSRQQSLEEQVRRAEAEVNSRTNALGEANRTLSRARSELEDARRDARQAQEEYDRANRAYQNQSVVCEDLNRAIRNLESRISSEESNRANLVSRLNLNQDRLGTIHSRLEDLDREIRSLRAQIPGIESRLPGLESAYNDALRSANDADRVADEAERITEAHRVRAAQVRRAYDERIALARNGGASQGESVGREEGRVRGEEEGTRSGNLRGSSEGESAGLIAGFENGRREASTRGEAEGYARTRNLPANYDAGVAEGIPAGEANARAEAERVDRPRGYNERKAAILAVLPTNLVELENRRSSPSGSGAGFRVTNLVEILAVNQDPTCDYQYEEFNNACREAYEQARRQASERAYTEAFARTDRVAYDIAYRRAFELNASVRYQEGYDLEYPLAIARGEARGAQDARNQGFQDGSRRGYSGAIDQARRNSYAAGVRDIEEEVRTHATLGLTDLAIVRDGEASSVIAPGDTIALQAKIANWSPVASTAQTHRVEWETLSGGILPPTGSVSLVGIPGNTLATVNHVFTAQIPQTARSGDVVRIRVTLRSPGGQSESREVSITIASRARVRIVSLETDTYPALRRLQPLMVSIRNTGTSTTDAGLQAVLTTNASTQQVRLNVDRIAVPPIAPGQTGRVQLSYTVNLFTAIQNGATLTVTIRQGEVAIATSSVSLEEE